MDGDLNELLTLGRLLDEPAETLGGETRGSLSGGGSVEGADARGGVRTAPAEPGAAGV